MRCLAYRSVCTRAVYGTVDVPPLPSPPGRGRAFPQHVRRGWCPVLWLDPLSSVDESETAHSRLPYVQPQRFPRHPQCLCSPGSHSRHGRFRSHGLARSHFLVPYPVVPVTQIGPWSDATLDIPQIHQRESEGNPHEEDENTSPPEEPGCPEPLPPCHCYSPTLRT